MPPKSFMNRLKRLDAYSKTLEEFRIRTTTGAVGTVHHSPSLVTLILIPSIVTLISTVIIGFLVMIELWSYMIPVLKPEIVVDGGKMEKLPINFDITFPNIPCHSKHQKRSRPRSLSLTLFLPRITKSLVWT